MGMSLGAFYFGSMVAILAFLPSFSQRNIKRSGLHVFFRGYADLDRNRQPAARADTYCP